MPHKPHNPALGLDVCPPEFEALVLMCGVPWKTLAAGGVMPKGTTSVRDAICHGMLAQWDGKTRGEWAPGVVGARLRMCASTVVRAAERHQARLDEIELAYSLAFGPKSEQPRPNDGEGYGFDTEAERPLRCLDSGSVLGRGPDGRFRSIPILKEAA